MLFPTVCVDNFFEDPKAVVKLANSLDTVPSGPETGIWPGRRTKAFYESAPEFNDYFARKLFSAFYDFRRDTVNWNLEAYFQSIEPYSSNPDVNVGWVHKDVNCVLAGVVYLNEDPNPDSGTSLFARKSPGIEPIHNEYKARFFADNSTIDEDVYVQKLKENNDRFVETLTVKNVYNRMVCYDSANFHRANSFSCGDKPRLTLVFFVRSVVSDWYPMPSIRTIG